MPDFRIKAAVQGSIARLPGSARINAVFQRFVTRRLRMSDARLDRKWAQVDLHLEHLAQAVGSSRPESLVVVELGTGWYPVVPVALILRGAHHVYTLDRESLLSHRRIHQTLDAFARRLEQGDLRSTSDAGRVRLERARSMGRGTDALQAMGITAVVGDAADFAPSNTKVDLFVSNNTLEHIPEPVIESIFRAFWRCARDGAVMSHFIDMADHYALFDPSISVLNYLRYSDRGWALLNNDLHFQNRLRLSDYRALHEKGAWEVVREETRQVSPDELAAIDLAKKFRGRSDEDLRTYDVWMVSRRRAHR